MLGRTLLTLGALLLIGTAAFHGSGAATVAGWLGGERGALLQTLWFIPVLDWATVGLAWLYIAWRGGSRLAPLVWLLALIPAGAAAMIAASVGPNFVGVWLLAGAALLALLGSVALPRAGQRVA
jgi:hypothetical protein